MRYLLLVLYICLVLGCEIIPESEKINVYFCGGQSNAKNIWYESIKNEILKVDPLALVIWQYHSGNPIENWYDDEISDNYISDSDVIKSRIDDIDCNFKAIFWFQGEADAHEDRYLLYSERFIGMINQYKIDFNDSEIEVYMDVIYSAEIECDNIRSVQFGLLNNYDFIYGIDTKPYERSDEWHVTLEDLIIVGSDIGKLYIENNY